MAEAPNKLQQFLMTDKKFLYQDVEFWASTMDAMLQFYRETSVETPDDRSAKAIAAARLVGLGLALTEHFTACVDTCVDTLVPSEDLEACEETGHRVYEMCDRHSSTLEERSRKALS